MDDLVFSARKKRKIQEDNDDLFLTPKKARISQATPSKTRMFQTPGVPPTPSGLNDSTLPENLSCLLKIHIALEQALSVSLAIAQISPDPDTGRVPAVLNHYSIQDRGLRVKIDLDDLKKLCWFWEWDGKTLPKSLQSSRGAKQPPSTSKKSKKKSGLTGDDEDDVKVEFTGEDPEKNPFIVDTTPTEDDSDPFGPPTAQPKEWSRGGMGFCITPTTHVTRVDGSSPAKRVPAYGIGIEVEWTEEDVTGGRIGGMTAVARWTTAGDKRKKTLRAKLETWRELTSKLSNSKSISAPSVEFPALPKPPATSKLTQIMTSATPRKLTFPTQLPIPMKTLQFISPRKGKPLETSKDPGGFRIPFPVVPDGEPVTPRGPRPTDTPSSGSSGGMMTPSSSWRSGGIRTPSFGRAAAKLAAAYTPSPSKEPATPTSSKANDNMSVPSTPTKGSSIATETPTSARRAALYDRIRAKNESEGSAKKTAVSAEVRSTGKEPPKRITKLIDAEELRRRTILGRLGTIAEAVWMLFAASGSSGASITTSARKRRTLERREVVRAVVKSSSVPISEAEAIESLSMLCDLCPFFLKTKIIGGEEWLEMPPPATTTAAPASPGPSSSSPRSTNDTPGTPGSPTRRSGVVLGPPGSPTRRKVIEDELMARSPRRIKREEGGLRQVRERIRRELEVDEDDDPFI